MQRITVSPEQIFFPDLILNHDQQHYLTRVLRLKVGDRFLALDGTGQVWLSVLDIDKARILEQVHQVSRELSGNITLIAALPKGNSFDDVVRSCTELGVSKIQPVISDRTLLQPSPQKLLRWAKIATEATEQSERECVPIIAEPMSFRDFLGRIEGMDGDRVICLARGERPHLLQWLRDNSVNQSLMVAIGPEGGWTDAEINLAKTANFIPVSLGNRVLRSITAPIVALSLISSQMEIMNN